VYIDTPRGVRPYGRTGAAALAALSVLATGAVVVSSPSAAMAAPSSTLTRVSFSEHSSFAFAAASAGTPSYDKPATLFGPTVKMATRVQRATHTTLTVDHNLVQKGHQVTFSGRLGYGAADQPLIDHPVQLQENAGSDWKTVASGLAGPGGSVTFTVAPDRTTAYRLSYPGVGALGASASTPQTVTVKQPPPPAPVRTSAPSTSYVSSGSGSYGTNGVAASGTGAAVVAAAAAQSGKPYVFAAAGPNAFDCSGLTMFVFAQFGVYLPHDANAQSRYGTPVSAADAAPGDLMIFLDGGYGYHAAIYAGGNTMYDAPNSGSTVGLHQIWGGNIIFRRLV
jgi:cell wall-associated NlpC family hydrolase